MFSYGSYSEGDSPSFVNFPVKFIIFLQDVKYLAISGFFFLRFFAPAILTPKLFQLRDQHADTRTSRTLLLLAKVRFTAQTCTQTLQ